MTQEILNNLPWSRVAGYTAVWGKWQYSENYLWYSASDLNDGTSEKMIMGDDFCLRDIFHPIPSGLQGAFLTLTVKSSLFALHVVFAHSHHHHHPITFLSNCPSQLGYSGSTSGSLLPFTLAPRSVITPRQRVSSSVNGSRPIHQINNRNARWDVIDPRSSNWTFWVSSLSRFLFET